MLSLARDKGKMARENHRNRRAFCCTNVVLYRSSPSSSAKEKLGVYCWGNDGCYIVNCSSVEVQTISLGVQPNGSWRTFSNRAGWSLSYPADWHVGSCKSCKDPTAPDVFVDFFPPEKRDSAGWVMVEHLASKPSDSSVDAWFAEISKTANLNTRLSEERITLDGSPALKVRYRTATRDEMEAVYVVVGLETFEICFAGQTSGIPLEKLDNHATYLKMLGTFRVKRR